MAIPTQGFGATEIRPRAYVTGAALAMLLDRYDAGWTDQFDADGRQSLDQTLQSKLTLSEAARDDLCRFSSAETLAAIEQARIDVAAVQAAKYQRRTQFDSRDTWRLIVKAAEGKPLWPQGFDPLNVEPLEGGLLHTRFLRLGNEQGYLEAIDSGDVDIEAFTVAAGAHPLFNGIEEVTIVGPAEHELTAKDGYLSVQTPGLNAEFESVSIHHEAGVTIVQLKQPK